jgi:peptidase E
MGATNTPKEITFVGHTHGLADIVSGVTAGALVYGSSTGSFINLPIGNANDILKVVGNAPI